MANSALEYLIIAVVAGGFFLMAANSMRRSKRIRGWPETDATIISKAVTMSDPNSYQYNIRYSFKDQEIEAPLNITTMWDPDEMQIGEQVRVRVNPENPQNCFLAPPTRKLW